MKLHHSDDETGLTLSDRDREVIRAAFDTADSLRDLADAAGLLGRGTCAECGDYTRTRPMRLRTESGATATRPVCGECQERLVELDESELPDDAEAEIDLDVDLGGGEG